MNRRGVLLASSAALTLPRHVRAQTAEATLLLNTGSEPDSIDPARVSFIGEVEKVMRVFRNLLAWDATGALVPDQAASLPVVEDGGRSLIFTLRRGLVYSDGRPLTARDFEYGWKRHLAPDTRSEYAFAGYVIAGAEAYNTADPLRTPPEQLSALRDATGVRALDDHTLQLTLTAPAPWFLSVLATWCGLPVRADIIGRAGDRWTEPATYIGNGPYVLAEWDHGSRLRFEANPLYHAGPPPIRYVEQAMIGEPAVALAAYLNDELDVAGVQVEDRSYVQSDARLRSQFHEYPGGCTFYVGFNTRKPPFDDARVRAAFSLALDRTTFVRNILGGQGRAARQFVPPAFPGNYLEIDEQIFDPARGAQLLAAAGYPGGSGFGELKWAYSAGARSRVRIEALVNQLGQNLGVRIEPDPVEARTFAAALKRPEAVPMLFLAGWCQDYPDPQSWYSIVFSSRSSLGRTGWNNPDFDRLTAAADTESDPTSRHDLYRAAAQLLVQEAPAAFLYHSVAWVLVKPRLRGYREDPFEYFLGEHALYDLRLE